MTHRGAGLRRLVVMVSALVLLATAAGCSNDGSESPTGESTQVAACEDDASGSAGQECYDRSAKRLYCVVELVRYYHDKEYLPSGGLPKWALTEARDGAPIVYDVRASDPPVEVDAATDALIGWLERQAPERPINRTQLAGCTDRVSDAEIRESEGGGPGSSSWGSTGA